VTHDPAEWKGEIAWMSLYFSLAVWASLALCVFYAQEDRLAFYRTETTVAGQPETVTASPVPVKSTAAGSRAIR
jgi:hypothetical protein